VSLLIKVNASYSTHLATYLSIFHIVSTTVGQSEKERKDGNTTNDMEALLEVRRHRERHNYNGRVLEVVKQCYFGLTELEADKDGSETSI
jgi:hypothetical protein